MKKQKRVLIYARVSTSHLDQNPDVQVRELKRYCEARDWIVVEELVDHGLSGSNDKRPAFQKLKQMVLRREIDGVVVTKLDRLSRSLKDAVNILQLFQEIENFEFVSIKDNIDLNSSMGRFFAHVIFCFAELERSTIVDRINSGLAYAKENGVVLGRPKFKDENKIIELKKNGKSYREIQKELGCSASVITRVLKAHFNHFKN
ncbi:MAG: recombinase family protein [Pseudobdellovibrio sp.]